VTALRKDAGTEWLELSPLPQAVAAKLVEAVLGSQVDGATHHELWRLSLGNVMFLRELVHGALKAGTLVQSEGVWRATGTLATSTRLVEWSRPGWVGVAGCVGRRRAYGGRRAAVVVPVRGAGAA
jgi:hypothetical protein